MNLNKLIILGCTTLLLTACGTTTDTTPAATQTPVAMNAIGSATPTPSSNKPATNPSATATPVPEPAFRTRFELQSDAKTLKVGQKATVKLVMSGIQHPITTLSTMVKSTSQGMLSGLKVNTVNFPLAFKKDVSSDGQSISLAISNQTGISGDNVEVASFELEAKQAGNITLSFSSDDTSVLMKDNTNVTPKSPEALTITVTP